MKRPIAFAALALLAACDDGGEAEPPEGGAPSACADLVAAYEPCGGDVVGTWRVRQGCLALSLAELDADECPDELPAELAPEGTLAFGGDGVLVDEVEATVVLDAHVDDRCLEAVGRGLAPPDQLCALVQEEAHDRGFEGSCVHVGGCACRLSGALPARGTRRWVVDGTALRDPDDATVAADFCVDGDALTVRSVDDAGVTTHLVLDREAP